MSNTVRQIGKLVQKIAKTARLDPVESELARDCIVGISKTGSCKVSEIARFKNGKKCLREETQPIYEGLARKTSRLDRLREAWLRVVARVANTWERSGGRGRLPSPGSHRSGRAR